jgi:hypothetical protein
MMGTVADCWNWGGSWGWGMMAFGGVWIAAVLALLIWTIVRLTGRPARDGR